MKPTHKKKAPASPVEQLRKQTAYGMARLFLSVPFYILGGVVIFLNFLIFPLAMTKMEVLWLAILASIPGFLTGLFLLSIPAVAHGFFDMADCALRREQRDAARDARESYEAYKKSQEGY